MTRPRKKSRRKRDSNPASSALEADALPLGQRGGRMRGNRGSGTPWRDSRESWSETGQSLHSTASVAKWVRRPPRERKIPGSNPDCTGTFSAGSCHSIELKFDTSVTTLPCALRYRVSAGTGQPGVSILWLGEVESLNCNFYLSLAPRTIVCADLSLRYTRMTWSSCSCYRYKPLDIA